MDHQSNSNKNTDELEKLRKFYRAVGKLTLFHDVLSDSAVVYPSKLGPLLEEIDPKWYMRYKDEQTKG